MPDLPEHGLTKDEIRNGLRLACAIAHGRGTGMSLLELGALILEDGLPPRGERDTLLAAKIAAGDDDAEGKDTALSSSPGASVDRRDDPGAAARGERDEAAPIADA